MTWYGVRLETEDMVVVGQGPEVAFFTEGLPYIPGSTLRGALAGLWIREAGRYPNDPALELEERRSFEQLFEGDVRFGPCHVVGGRLEGVSERFLKYRRADDDPAVVDLALGDEPPHPGYEGGKGGVRNAPMATVTRTAIDPDTGMARASHLFSVRGLAPRTQLAGWIVGEHDWLDRLAERGPVRLRVGARRSIAGSVILRVEAQSAPPVDIAATTQHVVVRLTSPAIFVDDATRPVIGFPVADLARAAGLAADQITVARQYVRPLRVHGWHAAAGLPKPDELAVAQGSTAVLTLATDRREAALTSLLEQGLGLRRNEGFGFVDLVTTCEELPPRDAAPRANGRQDPVELWFGELEDSGIEFAELARITKSMAALRATGHEATNLDGVLGRGRRRALSPTQEELLTELGNADAGLLEDLVYLCEAAALDAAGGGNA
jgi:CRISPR-associated protein Csx10